MIASTTSIWLKAATGEPRDYEVKVFVPSVTRDGKDLDHKYWREQALREMARLFGGATAVDGSGAWRDDERGGEIVIESNTTVFSLMAKSTWNEQTVSQLGTFLRRMGRETNQGEVGLIVEGHYLAILKFDQ